MFESLKEEVDAKRPEAFSARTEQREEMTKRTATHPEDFDLTFDL